MTVAWRCEGVNRTVTPLQSLWSVTKPLCERPLKLELILIPKRLEYPRRRHSSHHSFLWQPLLCCAHEDNLILLQESAPLYPTSLSTTRLTHSFVNSEISLQKCRGKKLCIRSRFGAQARIQERTPQDFMISNDQKIGYGSMEEAGGLLEKDKSFDATQMQYLGEGKELTKEEKIRKIMRIAVPLLLAVIIVAAAFLFLAKDFGHLYPGHGAVPHGNKVVVTNGKSSSSSKTSASTAGGSDTTTSQSSATTGAMKCSAHDGCAGLTGNCW